MDGCSHRCPLGDAPVPKGEALGQFHEPQQRGNVSASEASLSRRLGRRLLRYGIVLFLLGLATGRLVESLPLPRMGLSSHLEGVMNGRSLSSWAWSGRTFDCTPCFFGPATGWSWWAPTSTGRSRWPPRPGGVGDTTMRLAAGGHLGTPDQELTLLVGLRALNVAMFGSCFLVLWGLLGEGPFTGH